MENIPDHKYKIGDVVEVKEEAVDYIKIFRMIIDEMIYVKGIGVWDYKGFKNSVCEDQIIKKIN